MYVQRTNRKPWDLREPELVVYHDGERHVEPSDEWKPAHEGDLPPKATGAIRVWIRPMTGADERYVTDQTSEIEAKTKAMAIRAGKNARLKVVRLVERIEGYAVEGANGEQQVTTEISGNVYDAMPAFLTRAIAAKCDELTTMKEETPGE